MRTRTRFLPAVVLAALPALAWLGFGARSSSADVSVAPGLCADAGDPYARCDGGLGPTQTPYPGPTLPPSPSPVPSPTFTGPAPGPTPSPTFTPTPTPSPSPSPSPTPPAFDSGAPL